MCTRALHARSKVEHNNAKQSSVAQRHSPRTEAGSINHNGGPKRGRAAIFSDMGLISMPEQPCERPERSGACSSNHVERTSGFERTLEQPYAGR